MKHDKVTYRRGDYAPLVASIKSTAKARRIAAFYNGILIGAISALGGIAFGLFLVIMGA